MITCFFCGCSNNHSEVENIARNYLESYRELYALAIQTGRVTLPVHSEHLHVTNPIGGMETPINNVWIVNGNYMGKVYECHGCDLCMTHYSDAGLITYNVICKDSTSVNATVWLTEKGRQYLIERYITEPNSIINAWRRREQIEVVLVAKESFDIEVSTSDTAGVYHCKAYRRLENTPFIEALDSIDWKERPDFVRRLRIDLNDKEHPSISCSDMEQVGIN